MQTKSTLILVVVLCAAITSKAQISKGTYLIGGYINSVNTKSDFTGRPDFKGNGIALNTSVGKSIKENLVVGVILAYSTIHTVNNYYTADSGDYKLNQYTAGLFARKYKLLAKNFYFFGDVNAVYSQVNDKQEFPASSNYNPVKTNQKIISSALSTGISYQVLKKMQMELIIPQIISLQYSTGKLDGGENSAYENQKKNDFSIYSNLNANPLNYLGLGFKFILGGK